MKKIILVEALEYYEETILMDSSYYEIGIAIDDAEPTPATRRRFLGVLDKMIENARKSADLEQRKGKGRGGALKI